MTVSEEESAVPETEGPRIAVVGRHAVDTVVPLVTLGQRSTWSPDRAGPWGTVVDTWLNLATLLGWVLSSIFLLSFTRLARTA